MATPQSPSAPEPEVREPDEGGPDWGVRILKVVTFGLGAIVLVLFAWVVVMRFRYPIDGEWMTGAVRDGVDRLREGKPLYGPPTAQFIPFVYTPIYFWLAALVARVTSTFVACKLVSLAATAAMAWGIVKISRSLGASRMWSGVGVLLLAATYVMTLLFYDLARVDATSAAFVVCGLAIMVSGTSLTRTAVAGVILGLAFFAKQPGLLAFAAAVVGLFFAGERKRAMVAGAAGALAFAAMFAYLEVTTHGWFRYYCVKLPGSHGMEGPLLSTFFVFDLPRAFAYALGSVAIVAPVAWSFLTTRRAPRNGSWQNVVFAFVLAAGMAGAFSMRAHKGGWTNVLVAWLPIACAACAVAATRAEEWARGTRSKRVLTMIFLGVVSLQLFGGMFDPNDLSPNADDLAEHERFVGLVRSLEKEGDVIITTTGNVAHPSSVHAAALFDVVRAGYPTPPDLERGLEDRRFAALFAGAPDEFICKVQACKDLVMLIARNYFVAGRRHEQERTGMVGLDARPRWLMRPRKAPAVNMSFRRLMARQHIEMSLALVESAKLPLLSEIEPTDAIEALADRQLLDAVVDETTPDR